MELHILDHRLRVTSIAKSGLAHFTHPLIKLIFLRHRTRCKFFSMTETPENYTVVLDEEGFKELEASSQLQVEGSVWLPLNVLSDATASLGLQAVGVTKIAESVIAPLARQHVSVFMLSTYQTDFILVREKDLPVVVGTLEEFKIFREVGGESILVRGHDITNGLHNNGKEAVPAALQPVLIPQNRFCVMSLDPDTLPSIATTLIDVLFYSGRSDIDGLQCRCPNTWWRCSSRPSVWRRSPKQDEATSPSADLDQIKFFSFSLIDGYVSLVMDTDAQRRFPADLLFTSSSGELWRMVRIGGQPLGFDECGIVAQISQPLADCDISAYYISTFSFDHALPSDSRKT
ncbi:cytosolic arginine sensor for mTORC1 subunit 1 isoform X2 [Hippocampus zosterae]|uniref:cytosolic arginine sensor for mTORC1 subunit 1 isoform X2 n=1 Tax=Hippocampus zosterae TaxID=109293 RepID=UPI00223E20CD|nr:cytosolic arginine sensor for mTORC1 subunit 1 isoform X2 [Hippocampus zosterae]